ncbi:MAG: acyl-CoA dehydratase activase [Christensenellales bacterium]|jgi:predicted CoA-substrate-specific enzyme activase
MHYIGIDIGSASACLALLSEQGELIGEKYLLLKGAAKENRKLLQRELTTMLAEDSVYTIAASGSGSKMLNLPSVNEVSALAAGARYVAPDAASVMEIGGGSAKYVVDLQKSHIQFALNDNCSAGTGSFFAAQMQRLGLPLEAYSDRVAKAENIAPIAGRCSVFAKTDIIHSQQAGTSMEDILLGLCYAVVRNYKASVAGKLPLQKPVLLAGGTALNKGVIDAVKDVFKLDADELLVLDASPVVTAIGTALLAKEMGRKVGASALTHILEETVAPKSEASALPPLQDPNIDLGSLQKLQPFLPDAEYYLGIDIGSTSTNLVLLNKKEEVVHFSYLRTKGDPKGAVAQGLEELKQQFGSDLKIRAAATTGSGRHYIGRLIGADTVQDEITAQAAAAAHFMPEVDTVMEIGGQDSKYISITDTLVRNFEMNKICAAGTGAFIEEQAAKLGVPIEEFGKTALAAKAPVQLGDQCTVLIESNIGAHLADGASKEDLAAGLCYSIVSNYLSRVVGARPVGKNILLLGGVAYNPAIIAAFKERFGRRTQVGRYFHVNGAVGAALLAKNNIGESASTFKGLTCLDGDAIEESDIDRHKTAEDTDTKAPKLSLFNHKNDKDPNKKTIGMPRALYIYNIFPVASAFFQQLGYNVILSDDSSEKTTQRAQSHARTEVCYPLKLAMGHVAQLLDVGIDYLFMPSLVSLEDQSPGAGANCACVYMHSAPSMLAESLNIKEQNVSMIAPVLDLSEGYEKVLPALYQAGLQLGHSESACQSAMEQSAAAMPKREGRKNEGPGRGKSIPEEERAISKALHKGKTHPSGRGAFAPIMDYENSDKPIFVLISRGYCAKDSVLSLNLQSMMAERGYQLAVPKQLPKVVEAMNSQTREALYWPFASRAMLTAKSIAEAPNLYAVYLTYHGCGPDTLVSHWVEDEMKGKPYLQIEVDEHSSNVGVITRLDAFINSVLSHKKRSEHIAKPSSAPKSAGFSDEIQALKPDCPVAIPYRYPYSRLLAAHLHGKGFDVVQLAPTSPDSLKEGRSYMRGKECFSLTALLGAVSLEAKNHNKLQLLYPQNNGAEADGLYAYFVHRKLTEKLSVTAPNIDKLPLREKHADALFRISLAGDIALCAGNDALVSEMEEAFRLGIPDDTTLIRWAKGSNVAESFYLVIGEPGCMMNPLFHKIILQTIRDHGVAVRFAPLSEMLLSEWKNADGFAVYGSMAQLMARVSAAMGQGSVFGAPSKTTSQQQSSDYDVCSGGYAEYRRQKAAFTHPKLLGIIAAASQHENTQSILDLAPHGSKAPLLNIRFDGTDDPVNRLKIDTFLHEAMY